MEGVDNFIYGHIPFCSNLVSLEPQTTVKLSVEVRLCGWQWNLMLWAEYWGRWLPWWKRTTLLCRLLQESPLRH